MQKLVNERTIFRTRPIHLRLRNDSLLVVIRNELKWITEMEEY